MSHDYLHTLPNLGVFSKIAQSMADLFIRMGIEEFLKSQPFHTLYFFGVKSNLSDLRTRAEKIMQKYISFVNFKNSEYFFNRHVYSQFFLRFPNYSHLGRFIFFNSTRRKRPPIWKYFLD